VFASFGTACELTGLRWNAIRIEDDGHVKRWTCGRAVLVLTQVEGFVSL